MSKIITLSIIVGIFTAISPAEAKITRCLNHLGEITFTDTSCHVKSNNLKQSKYFSDIKPLVKEEVSLKKTGTKKFKMYCHKSIGQFYEC